MLKEKTVSTFQRLISGLFQNVNNRKIPTEAAYRRQEVSVRGVVGGMGVVYMMANCSVGLCECYVKIRVD